MKHRAILTVLALAAIPSLAFGQGSARPSRPAYKREVPAALLHHAKVSEDSSLKVASARIPGGAVQSVELENENGKLIWSWEFTLAGRPGVYECNVNAADGSIVGVEHEMPKADGGHAHH